MCSPLWIVLSLMVWSLFSKKFRFLTCVSLLASYVMMFIENCSAIMVCKLDKIPENTCVKNSKTPHSSKVGNSKLYSKCVCFCNRSTTISINFIITRIFIDGRMPTNSTVIDANTTHFGELL
ncbi:hypothetical protein VN0280_10360 [Helicobacter pylori]|nr:hypothetical protein VN0280_10360 [Helicobacter pylori]